LSEPVYYLTRADRDKLNRLLAMIDGAGGLNISPDGISVPQQSTRRATPQRASQVVRLRFHSEQNDYIVCHAWDGTNEGTDAINVAKPWTLRHDADNYANVTSLSTTSASEVDVDDGGGGEDEETWVVTPSYQADDEIYALRTRGTGVEVSGTELGLVDLNHAGRAWAVE
jgi:hypothetical protein